MNEVDKNINNIKKHLKKSKLLLEIYLLNYETYNIYIRIDYLKKLDVYKISWFDLEIINNNIEKYIGSEYISKKEIKEIITILENKDNNFHEEQDKNKVVFNAYINEGYHYQFTRFIHKNLSFLSEIFVIIFNNLPKKLDSFLYELHAELMNTRSRYEYNDSIIFDLYNDDLNRVFYKKIIERAEQYYNDGQVKFLEKIEDKYYAIVSGTEKYLTVIKYNEDTKEMLVYCTCPCKFYCKHLYAIIKAIRNNKEHKFYKVLYINKKENLLENIINTKYLLCSGLEEDCLEIINKYGEIELVPLLDEDNNINFKILEEDKERTLSKEIQKIINVNYK